MAVVLTDAEVKRAQLRVGSGHGEALGFLDENFAKLSERSHGSLRFASSVARSLKSCKTRDVRTFFWLNFLYNMILRPLRVIPSFVRTSTKVIIFTRVTFKAPREPQVTAFFSL
jgi:hypothetical protein